MAKGMNRVADRFAARRAASRLQEWNPPGGAAQHAPHTVLISAGVESQYGHPHSQALQVYDQVAKYVFSTSMEGGVSLLTQPGAAELTTTLIRPVNPTANAA
jgi:hypothetical protein